MPGYRIESTSDTAEVPIRVPLEALPPTSGPRSARSGRSKTLDLTDRGERILVIRLGAVGDVVRTLPAVAALRRAWPDAHLTWLVESKASGVVRSQPWIDDVIVFPREDLVAHGRRLELISMTRLALQFASALRRRRFDRTFDFHANFKSGVLSRLSGASERFGYDRSAAHEASWLFATRRAALPAGPVSRFERNATLAALAGVSVGTLPSAHTWGNADPQPRALVVDPAARKRIGEWLADSQPLRGREFVAVHAGSSPATPYKRYPAGQLAEVARSLSNDGFAVVVTWGPAPGERVAAEALVAAVGGASALAPSTERFEDLAALLEASRLFIGADSGPLHVASLVGTPAVQILGPTHPVENAPYPGTPSRSVRVAVPCSPCRRGCAAVRCMKSIPAEAVIDAARELLAETALAVGP